MYENLYGRTGILALAPISLLGAIFILNIKRWSTPVFFVVLAQILIISLPAVILYKTLPAPNESLAKAQQESEPGGVFISSNVTRTWNAYDGHFVNFGDVGVGAGEVYRAAQEAIQNGREAYISSDAIYFPFWRYDGKYFDLRSRNIGKSSDHQSLLYELFTRLNVTLERTSDKFKQSIYSVSSSEQTDKYQRLALAAKVKPIIFGRIMSSDMPVQNLTVNLYNKTFCQREREDITRNDLLLCLMRELTSSKSASNFTPTDRDGWFYMANELKNPTLEIVPDGVNTRSGNSQALFAAPVFQKISSSDSQLFDNLDSLKEAISRIDGSFYVIAQTSGDEVVYQLFKFNYILPKTNLLEAEKMSGEIGDIARSKGVSNFQVRTNNVGSGFMISGPYINLPAGKYTIGFSLKSGKIIDPNSTVNFDVVSAASGESFASVGKNASDFQNGFTLQNINFELLNETSSLEFRVRTEGKAEVLVDYLVLNHF